MNLKRAIDVDELRAQLEQTGKDGAEALLSETKRAIEQLEAAASTMRDLAGLPTGELLERAIVAEVVSVTFCRGAGQRRGQLQAVNVDAQVQLEGGASVWGNERLTLRLPQPPTIVSDRPYRVIVLLLEQKPAPR